MKLAAYNKALSAKLLAACLAIALCGVAELSKAADYEMIGTINGRQEGGRRPVAVIKDLGTKQILVLRTGECLPRHPRLCIRSVEQREVIASDGLARLEIRREPFGPEVGAEQTSPESSREGSDRSGTADLRNADPRSFEGTWRDSVEDDGFAYSEGNEFDAPTGESAPWESSPWERSPWRDGTPPGPSSQERSSVYNDRAYNDRAYNENTSEAYTSVPFEPGTEDSPFYAPPASDAWGDEPIDNGNSMGEAGEREAESEPHGYQQDLWAGDEASEDEEGMNAIYAYIQGKVDRGEPLDPYEEAVLAERAKP